MQEEPPDRRDSLALVRTDLANERTLLAYLRTGLITAGSGLTLIKFFPDLPLAQTLGPLLLVLSPGVALLGLVRFVLLRMRLRRSGQE